MKKEVEDKLSEATLQIYDENSHYIENAIDHIFRYFKDTGKTWGFDKETITRDMIEETILDLIDTILESDPKLGCDEAGTGGIVVRMEFDEDEEFYDLTILLEF